VKFNDSIGATSDTDPILFVFLYKLKSVKGSYSVEKNNFITIFAKHRALTMPKIKQVVQKWKQTVLADQYAEFIAYLFDYVCGDRRKSLPVAETIPAWIVVGMPERWTLWPKWKEYLELPQNSKLIIKRDEWNELPGFAREFNPSNPYDSSGSYPSLFDEFVDWYMSNKS